MWDQYKVSHNSYIANRKRNSIHTGSEQIQEIPHRCLRQYDGVDNYVTQNSYKAQSKDTIKRNFSIFLFVYIADQSARNAEHNGDHCKIGTNQQVRR